jgi:hypothetical protein
MDTNDDRLLLKEEVFRIVGCAIEVLNVADTKLIDRITDHERGA